MSGREDKLDAIVMDCLLERLLTADRVGSIVREVHKQNNSDRKGSEGHLRPLKINLSRVEREESNLWDLAARLGLQVAEGFKTKAASLENERDTLQRGISEIQECIFPKDQPPDFE